MFCKASIVRIEEYSRTEFVVAAYLNPRLSTSMGASYGFYERLIYYETEDY